MKNNFVTPHFSIVNIINNKKRGLIIEIINSSMLKSDWLKYFSYNDCDW